jgi:ABC-type amino acid transport substrate-binding protein
MPTQRSLVESSNGLIDGELVRIHKVGELYPTLLRVPTPYTFFESTAFSKIPDVLPDTGWRGLKDYRVGMVRGMKHAEWGLRDIESVVAVNITKQLFDMLEFGRIDIAVTSRISGLYFIKNFDLQPLHIVKPPLQNHDLYHYLHEKNAHYIPILDETIRAMKETGELVKLKEKYIAELLE